MRNGVSMRRLAKLALVAFLIFSSGLLYDMYRDRAVSQAGYARLRPGYGPKTFAAAVARTQADVEAAREDYETAPSEWLRGEILARALIAKWRLTGNYDDLAEADAVIDQGLRLAPKGSGPLLERAALSVLLHRLGQAEIAIEQISEAVMPDSADTADAKNLSGDISLQRGKLDLAQRKFEEASALVGAKEASVRSAMLEAYRGHHAKAASMLEALLVRPGQQAGPLADLLLLRTNIAYMVGDWETANRHINEARRIYPGYWLADAYAAQQLALKGDRRSAAAAYRGIAQRTERPEVMDALAHLLRLMGDGAGSRVWSGRAASAWHARAALFPEAVAHHLAEHELTVGSAHLALPYARLDAVARPQATNLVLYARVLLSVGDASAARAVLDRADAQGWVSAGQYLARAQAAAAVGDLEGYREAIAKAEGINPRSTDPRSQMIWFGHD